VAGDGRATESRFRLPRTAIPSRYELVLEPDLKAGAFAGTEDVTLAVTEATREVVLNAVDLELGPAWLCGTDERRVAVGEILVDTEGERAQLRLAEEIEPGEWTLHLEFRGALNDRMRGFYRSTYADEDGVRHTIAATQFESTDARRAFPCWDEPDLKAVFDVTLLAPDGLVAVSNCPEASREATGDGRVRIGFAETMPISTYLVAFVVGPLEVTEPVDVDGVPLRIVHAPGKGNLTAFALEIGAFSLRFFSNYYGIAYPGDKLDMIAVPDFAGGAMENLGCITYREASLLLDPDKATQPELQLVADTVAHEIAHMWFGDLVTMRWWNGVWLNEAFATFMEMLCVDAFRPAWDRWALHARSRSAAFEIDALGSTRAIEYPVASPNDASDMFDTLTYVKGASVLRMLERYLGGERFRDGIRRYLAEHAHGNTEASDLWDAIEAATGEPVRRIMDPWIWQGGFPLVSASLSTERGEVRLQQGRFRADGADDGARWEVPMLVRHGTVTAGTVEPVLVGADGTTIAHREGALVVNAGAHSFARVRYDEELWARISATLAELSATERHQSVDDAWASTVAGVAPASAFCRLASTFAGETDLPVWQALLVGLGWCDRLLEGAPRERFRGFVRELLRPVLDAVGWEAREADADLTKALRGTLFAGLGVLGADPEAIALAREIDLEARSQGAVDPALAAAAVTVVATSGGAEQFDAFLAARAAPHATPQEQLRYLMALAEFRDPGLLSRTLELSLGEDVRPQNVPQLLARALANRDLGPLAWRFVRDRWEALAGRIAPSNVIYLTGSLRTLTSPELVDEVQGFFAEHPIPQSTLQLRQMLELQRVYAAFAARARGELEEAFGA
jgi:aminopeptidase N